MGPVAAATSISKYWVSLATDWIELGSPAPRRTPRTYIPIVWPNGRVVSNARPLPTVAADSVADLLARRRSCRKFAPARPRLLCDSICGALWLAYRTLEVGDETLGFQLTRRPTPSAGAIHPLHIVAGVPDSGGWCRFDSREGHLVELRTAVREAEVRAALDEVVPATNAAILLFVAEPDMTAAKYESSSSLVWRDAGVLQGTISLVAEAMGLGFTLLGMTGDPWSRQLVQQAGLHGVGLALIGLSGE